MLKKVFTTKSVEVAFWAILLVAIVSFGMPVSAYSLPGFARADKVDCRSCHSSDAKHRYNNLNLNYKTIMGKSAEIRLNAKIDTDQSSENINTLPVDIRDEQEVWNQDFVSFLRLNDFSAMVGFYREPAQYWSSDDSQEHLWYRFGYSQQLNQYKLNFGLFGEGMNSSAEELKDQNRLNRLLFTPETVGLDATFSGKVAGYYLDILTAYMVGYNENELASYSNDTFSAVAKLNFSSAIDLTLSYKTLLNIKGNRVDSEKADVEASLGASFKLTDQATISSWYTNKQYGLNDPDSKANKEGLFTLLFISHF
ncbi:MAG: hypothetical protein ACN4E2_05090 [Nitrospinota bacterium]